MIERRFEIYVGDPLSEEEEITLRVVMDILGWDSAVTSSGKIMMVEGPKDIYEIIAFLGETGLASSVGNIREVVDYDPGVIVDQRVLAANDST